MQHRNLKIAILVTVLTVVFLIAAFGRLHSTISRVIQAKRSSVRVGRHHHDVHPAPASRREPTITSQVADGVKSFVFFVGYARSGHSIVAALMDAHPNMVVAHEFDIFQALVRDDGSTRPRFADKREIYKALLQRSRKSLQSEGIRVTDSKGYTLSVDGLWQGNFTDLKVIGDKAGGKTVQVYLKTPLKMRAAYERLKRTAGVPITVLHVVRNPFDIVATGALYKASPVHREKLNVSLSNKLDNEEYLTAKANQCFQLASSVSSMIKELKLDVMEIHHEEFVANPREVLLKICGKLGVDCPEEYLRVCEEKVYQSPTNTRKLVVWTPTLHAYMTENMKKFPFFKNYQ